MKNVHVEPTGGTVVVDEDGQVIAVATSWTHAAQIVEALNVNPYKPRLIDGMGGVEGVKDYRAACNVPLKTAKDEWDRRVAELV